MFNDNSGKTLLAKAVANALRTKGLSSIGGAFISLNSSDIVRAEVGESEKLVVQAFHTARTNSKHYSLNDRADRVVD